MKRLVMWVAAAFVAVIAIAGLWSAATTSNPQTVEQTAREVSQSLRCPTCAGESIADSSALLSDAMRQTVAQQVADGRTPEQIREWFAQRYGDEVLLAPPHTGYGALLWTVPVVLIGAATTVFLLRTRGARQPKTRRHIMMGVGGGTILAGLALVWLWLPEQQPQSSEIVTAQPAPSETDTAAQQDSVIAVLRDGVEQSPGSLKLRLALGNALEAAELHAEAAEQYAAASRLQPTEADIGYRHAFALVRSGDQPQAQRVLDNALEAEPAHAPSLLLLGVLLRDEDPERGDELLAQFAELEPDHPATQDVLAVLDGEPEVEVQP